MAILTRSNVLSIKEETTEGTLEAITSGASFVPLREGTSISNELQTSDSDELLNDIAKGKSLVVGEASKCSLPFYPKHSGVEGQEPELGIAYESFMGGKSVAVAEIDTAAGSTTTVLKVADSSSLEVGEALLIKDGTNGYSVRHIVSLTSTDITLNFALENAPASGIGLGKCILYKPASSGHKSISIEGYQASSNSSFKQAMSGSRATSCSFEFPAKERATGTIEFEGVNYFYNQVAITASNKYIDFNDGGVQVAILDEKVYKTPVAFAEAVASKMNGASTDTITCEYSNTTGKYTIASDGSTLELLLLSGTNNANYCDKIGFDKVDETGSLTYTSDNEADYNPEYTPTYDDNDGIIGKDGRLYIGDSIVTKSASSVTISISTPKTDINDVAAETGVKETLTLEREISLTANIILSKHDVDMFERAIENTTTQIQFVAGPKTGGNWDAGKTFSFWMQGATITAAPIQDENGYVIVAIEAKGFVSSTVKDGYLGWL